MKVLILGGTAFMGPLVARQLVTAGHTVAVFHRGMRPAPDGVEEIIGDRNVLTAHAKDFRRFKPEVVLDMICMTEAQAQATVAAFLGLARRLVVASSIDVYRAYGVLLGKEEGIEPTPLTEDSPLRTIRYPYRDTAGDPKSFAYAYDKIPVEQHVLGQPDLPGTIVRLPMVYGPNDGQHRLRPYLKRMDDNRPAILIGDGMAAWKTARGYSEDMAAALALCILDDRAAGRTFHVAEEPTTEIDWIRRIAVATGWQGDIRTLSNDRLPDHLREDMNTSQHLDADSSRIRTELGYSEITDPAEALAKTVAWERSQLFEIDPAEYRAEDEILR